MKNLLKKLMAIMVMAGTVGFAQDIQVFTADNSDGKITPKTIEEAFKKAGFFVAENRDMNFPFKIQFKETSFDVYNLFTFYSKPDTLTLAKEYPQIGLFAPLSMSIYTKKGEKTISVSTLTTEALATILEIPKEDKTLIKIGEMLKKALKTAMPNGKFVKLPYEVKPLKGERVTRFEMEIDPDEWEDVKDEFQMLFEGELAPNGFVMAGFSDLNYDFEEKGYEGFNFYDVYSICKLPVIYTVAKTRPEAGAFAPCSLYLYMKKGEEKMHIAYPSVYNWISAMGIDDKASLEELNDAQKRMEKILSGLME
ncbi:DUF302 domain-containing protein [Sulfurovum mangrovi]|uniref:DUF302 domain-containing protein n=1 Tax=Sulfurovum mangrovi TaxID=2893889 RepID=UPI001E619869|nr:DUF302 domain-containing protein [Sulfurovum mangrovi]UFH59658.1 DUF302 domain-containing protein [Sulfurovum mangrovi]UFH60804.1 DUF302 domain-containing protein [Sulfurovum mangrovi]